VKKLTDDDYRLLFFFMKNMYDENSQVAGR
jgi:hypothetical protein